MQGREHGEGMSKSETGSRSLSQGSWIRAWNGEGQAGSSVIKTTYKIKGNIFLSILFLSQKNKAHKISNKIPKIPDKNTHFL